MAQHGFSRFGLLITGVLALAACSGGSSGFGGDSESNPTPTAAPEVSIGSDPIEEPPEEATATLEAGRCGNPDGADSFVDVECAITHVGEFVASVALPPDVDSSLDATDDPAMHRACLDARGALLGDHPASTFLDAEFVVGAETVDCWVSVDADVLTGSIREVGLDAALGDAVLVDSLGAGECYRFVGDQFSFVRPAACASAAVDDTVRQHLGAAVLDDGPFPNDDVLTDDAIAACQQLIETTDFEVAIAPTLSVLTPSQIGWTVYGQRAVSCVGQDLSVSGVEASTASVCAGLADDDFARVDCGEPHGSEFAGLIESPVEVLPDDAAEASDVLIAACRPLVEELLGRSVTPPGFGVGFSSDAGPGESADAMVECFATTNLPAGLVGSIAELGVDRVLNGLVRIHELAPGACFLLDEDSFAYGTPANCGDAGALMSVGSFTLDDGDYLGEDAIREVRRERCGAILAASGLSADPDSLSGTFPTEDNWRQLDRRLVTCDATPN